MESVDAPLERWVTIEHVNANERAILAITTFIECKIYNDRRLLLKTGVAVETLLFLQKRPKLGG